jgi:chromosome segregation protein
MHLRSITLKGFKSFPDRTRLEFGAGVSVVVGPNGSGKSNITDAVLWALGEQSPVAVRGSSMQDVIFGGVPGRQATSSAEVELVLDDAEGHLGMGPEISIVRRLDRTGEGEYRLAGARCRLVDVIELLSDTGLGKEMHTVISQGRVESLVTSKPRDRRLLIEEAAGLGKHRKRRRRAQLKLERTQQNLDRTLDVEREARSRLRPLKRQAEAAELHARLERQSLEARWELARDDLRACREELSAAEAAVEKIRAGRLEVERELEGVGGRREAAEEALASRGARREELSRRCFVASSAAERIADRAERARSVAAAIDSRLASARQLVSSLERELKLKPAERAAALSAEQAREELRHAELALEAARREAARIAGELASVEQFLQSSARIPGAATALGDGLEVEPGYELPVAAALDGRLRAAIATDRGQAARLLDGAGAAGGRVLVGGNVAVSTGSTPPATGAEPLAARVRGDGEASVIARALLADAWLVDDLDGLPGSFAGIAVTPSGRVWSPRARELRQAPAAGDERVLAERNRREGLANESERAVDSERVAAVALQRAAARHDEASEAESALRPAQRLAGLAAAVERDEQALPALASLVAALTEVADAISVQRGRFEQELAADREAGEQVALELRACAHEEAGLQTRLHAENEALTQAEVAAQRARDRADDADGELRSLAARLELEPEAAGASLEPETRIERLARRREQLGPVNPLAREEYAQAVEHVEGLEHQREDLETALRELEKLIHDTDREIRESFEQTFLAAAANFEELAQKLFPGGRGRLRLVSERDTPARVLGGEGEEQTDAEEEEEELGVEIEITPAGKAMKRLSLLSGGEKAMTALAFLFAVFLARPCPFYVLDEVEAALDDLNIDRFLDLLRSYSDRAQFIVVTHQKRTMEAADSLYGVSMGADGISKVISRRLPAEAAAA